MWPFVALRRCMDDVRGNTAMIFGLSVTVLFGAAGAAIDYSRAHAVKSAAQGTLDAALLAAARNKDIGDDGVQALLEAYFDKPGAIKHDGSISGLVGRLKDGSTVEGEATLGVPTTLLNLLGIGRIEMRIGSRVARGLGSGSIEVALVLDTTKSMEGSRLASVKSAAKELVDTVFDLPDATDRVKFSLVPFAQYVNVGVANRNASWMDVPPDSSVTTTNCHDTYPNAVKSNCRMVNVTYYDDGVPVTYQTEECDWDYGAPVGVCVPYTATSTWNGCAGARANPLNIKDQDYGTRIPGIMNAYCPGELVGLIKEKASIKSGIDAMVASGETYIPTGIVWGWRTLSNRAPFSQSAEDPQTASGNVRKFLVLMTDGENRRAPRYPEGDHEASGIAAEVQANQLTKDVCDNIKADTQSKIEIFTIAFEVTSEPIKDILRYCATPGGAFFDAVDYSKLITAFGDIGMSIATARVTK